MQLISCTQVIRHFGSAQRHISWDKSRTRIKVLQWIVTKQLWNQAKYAQHWTKFMNILLECTMLIKVIINLHVKRVERRQFGDVACVQSQCVQQGIGRGQEAAVFLLTIVMNSWDYLRVTGQKWKGKT